MPLCGDLDSYRHDWESAEHWDFRKEFLETYRERFEQERLLCLAQVFANIEILGCTYPQAVMIEIMELAKEISNVEELREKRKSRTIVPFVTSASNAAKRNSAPSWTPQPNQKQSRGADSSSFKPDNSNRPGAAAFFNPASSNADDNIPSYYTAAGRSGKQGV